MSTILRWIPDRLNPLPTGDNETLVKPRLTIVANFYRSPVEFAGYREGSIVRLKQKCPAS